MADVVVPAIEWANDSEAVISAWLVSDGAMVQQGALIAELAVEKSQFEVISPFSGKIVLLKPIEAVVRKGDVIATIE